MMSRKKNKQTNRNEYQPIQKSAQRHANTAVVRWSQKITAPPQNPFPGARDDQSSISWGWSLPSPTDPVGEDRCTQFPVIMVTDPHTNTPTHKQI